MAQKTSSDRLEEGKKIIPSKIVTNLKTFIHPLLMTAAGSKIKYKIIKCGDYSEMKKTKRPIIFACNHTNSHDVPIAFKAIGKHTILFAGKQPLEIMDEFFFNMNGTVYVDRKDKNDMRLSKKALVETLKNNNVLVFPSGTWNTTDSKLIPDMKWGIIEVARDANALIVPMALFYDYDKQTCKYNFGKAIDVNGMTNKEGIDTLQNAIGTMMWDFVEDRMREDNKDFILRSEIDVKKEKAHIENCFREYPKLDRGYEESIVFHSTPTPEEVYAPIKKLHYKNK